MKICEIFASIQGESTHAGRPCVFVRLTGCNLQCAYCDTRYAYEEGAEMTIDAVVEAVRTYGIPLVEITGGEPLIQEGSSELIQSLLADRFSVLVETNGTVEIAGLDRRATIIMDIKTPGSGMNEHILFDNLEHLKPGDEVKFVLTDRADYEWATAFIDRFSLADRCTVLFAPAFGTLAPDQLSRWIIEDRLPVRLNLQLHKYIYPPDQRGV